MQRTNLVWAVLPLFILGLAAERKEPDRSSAKATLRTILEALKADDVRTIRSSMTMPGKAEEKVKSEHLDILAESIAALYRLTETMLAKYPKAFAVDDKLVVQPSRRVEGLLKRLDELKEVKQANKVTLDLSDLGEDLRLEGIWGPQDFIREGDQWLWIAGYLDDPNVKDRALVAFVREIKLESEVFRKIIAHIKADKYKTFEELKQIMEGISEERDLAKSEGREPRFKL
jgi:hypothetical protein